MSIYSMLLLVAILLPLLSSLKSSINFRKSSIISYQNQYQLSTSIQLISHSQPARYLQVRFMSMTDEAEDSTTTETDIGDDGEEILDDVEVVATNLNATDSTTTNTTEPIDPKAEILKAKISALTAQERQLENAIATERLNLLRVKDKVSESGKTGYFIVQAQVAEFLKKKDAEQKSRIKSNQKDFVVIMLPVVDEFRNAPKSHPATTERESNMHKSFGPLLDGILTVFKKFGYHEFAPAVGDKYDGQKHEAVSVVPGDVDGLVVDVVKSGFADKEDSATLRRAQVVVSKIEKVEADKTTAEVESAAPAAE